MKKIMLFVLWVSLVSAGCTTMPQPDGEENIVKAFYANGVLKSVWVMQNGKLNGIKREYTQDGILQSATNYKNGKIDGMHNIYREDGSLWTREIYENGKLTDRADFDDEGYLISEDTFE
jgi:antitoxin component YwqK of YwqJK toxin-antitoxin module